MVDTNVSMVDINASAVETNSVVVATVAVTECDIGKLLLSGINVQRLNREHIFKILSCEPNSNASYSRIRSTLCVWSVLQALKSPLHI